MKLIAHRGNINGPDSSSENSPDQIIFCIEHGYDVEIDLRYDPKSNTLWLGHDEPQYMITWWWLAGKAEKLWIHCKDITTLHEFSTKTGGYNYFWHQEDDYTLTSNNQIWAYPGKTYTENTIIVMPEWNDIDWDELTSVDCYGICSDYVGRLK